VKFAYADPPYLGQAKKHYGPEAREVNHELLIAHLNEFDAWALSLSSPSLRTILPMCPADVRVMAWVKPFAAFKVGVNPAYAWEPIIVRGGRKRDRNEPTVRDWVSTPITLRRGVSGAKPETFCMWLFDVVGLHPIDQFYDVFPGSGAVSDAWEKWRGQMNMLSRDIA
jgi:hypothetical protein